MSREDDKSRYELDVFDEFLRRSKLSIDMTSVRNGDPALGEPDILCKLLDGSRVGFELGRLTNPDLKQAQNRWNPVNGEYIRTRDYSPDIARGKLAKVYVVPYPVDLILYREHPQITPDDVAIPSIRPLAEGAHAYGRVWFMGDTLELLYECV